MTGRLDSQADLDRAVATLAAADSRFGVIVAQTGLPALRRRPAGFAGLAAIVMGQQLSVASAAAIWTRLAAAVPPVDAAAIARADDAVLVQAGLSRGKIRTLRAVAAAGLDLDTVASLDADAAQAALTALHGIGPWTADVYLLFCLGNADAWPAGDLALQEAVRAGLGLPNRPGVKEMAQLGNAWRPFRGAAAHVWWAYYKLVRGRAGVAG